MKKPEIIQALIDEQGFTEEELKDFTYPELRGMLKEWKNVNDGVSDDGKSKDDKSPKPKAKKYYPKDEFFNQSIDMVDRKSKIPKAVSVPVDYRIIKFKHGEVKFVKGQEVSKTELALMSDYQKDFYLDAK